MPQWEDPMAHLPDGPLGPNLKRLGFRRARTMGDRTFIDPDVSRDEQNVINMACSAIALKQHRFPELPLFMVLYGSSEAADITVFVDVKGQVWFAHGDVNLREALYIDHFNDVD